VKNGIADWDCAGAIDIPAMADALAYIRQHAAFPVKPPFSDGIEEDKRLLRANKGK
jgi:uridine kinase